MDRDVRFSCQGKPPCPINFAEYFSTVHRIIFLCSMAWGALRKSTSSPAQKNFCDAHHKLQKDWISRYILFGLKPPQQAAAHLALSKKPRMSYTLGFSTVRWCFQPSNPAALPCLFLVDAAWCWSDHSVFSMLDTVTTSTRLVKGHFAFIWS